MLKHTFLLTLTLLASVFGNAQVQREFTPRFSQSIRGDFTIIANNTISRTNIDSYNKNTDNDEFNDLVHVDIDNDPTTFSSSSANFTNPNPNLPCITIYKAYLYWAASDTEKNSDNDDNQTDWNFNDIKLMLPGQTAYTTLSADDIIYRGRDTHFSNDPYACVKDITDLVLALPEKYGTYQVANIEGAEGSLFHDTSIGVSGGWQIVFVYESNQLPSKNITLFDGYAHVLGSSTTDITFDGFVTTDIGDVKAKVVLGSLEGDQKTPGDRLKLLNTLDNFVDLEVPERNANNFFNSSITKEDGHFINRNPASTNTLGFDAAVFNLNNLDNSLITNNQSDITMRITSTRDVYGIYLLGLAIENYQPNLNPLIITQSLGENPTNTNSTIGFSFNIENTGNDNALNAIFKTLIPQQTTLVTPLNLPDGVTYTYTPTTRELIFTVENGYLNTNSPLISVNFELDINEDCYFLEDSCNLIFDLQIAATYNGAQNPNTLNTLSTSNITSCEPLPLNLSIIQPSVNWRTPTNALDTTLSCEDTEGLKTAQALEPEPNICEFTLIKTPGRFTPTTCPNTGTYTNRWNFIDACGVTISDFTQTITIEDNIPPTASNPETILIKCISELPTPNTSVVIDEADNCLTPTVSFLDAVSDKNTCPETITRRYTVADACGNSIIVSQNFIINDDIKPEVIPSLKREITLTCENIPEVPKIVFTDNCTPTPQLAIEFKETKTAIINTYNYDITRYWKATDFCNNENTFTQTIHIKSATQTKTHVPNICIEDTPINLNTYIFNPDNNAIIWKSDTNVLSNTSIFTPKKGAKGDSYQFSNTYVTNLGCKEVTIIDITLDDECITYPCIADYKDIVISEMVTPNNDGENDIFKVNYTINENYNNNTNCDIVIDVKIYNRWGVLVYESRNYNNDWNGVSTTKLGSSNKLPTGTYYYIVELKNSQFEPIQSYIYLGTE